MVPCADDLDPHDPLGVLLKLPAQVAPTVLGGAHHGAHHGHGGLVEQGVQSLVRQSMFLGNASKVVEQQT